MASMSARKNSKTRRWCVAGLAFLAVTTAGSSGITQEKFQKLTAGPKPAQIARLGTAGKRHLRRPHYPHGTVMSTSMGRKRTGKWRVEQNQLCIEFEKEPVPKCYDVWLSGQQVELRREGLLPLQGTLEPSSGQN